MDFYSAWRDKVFIAVVNYSIKGTMALGLRTGTPVRVRLPGFTSPICLSAVTCDKLTSSVHLLFPICKMGLVMLVPNS